MTLTLVLGGARSGKSEFAERLAAATGAPVTYLATAPAPSATDDDLAGRIALHRARRPSTWTTVEAAGDLVGAIRSARGTVLVDALGPWVAGLDSFAADAEGLCAALTGRPADTVVVSEEVGLGVHPSSHGGRRFRDVLGVLNQRVAAVADDVVLVVAGRALSLPAAWSPATVGR